MKNMLSKEALVQQPEIARTYWQLWRQGQRPALESFLSAAGEISLSQMVAVLRVDQREHWLLGERVPAEAYLQRYTSLQAEAQQALDLVYAEFLLREELVEKPDVEEFA